jgi:hypothetical protein
VDATALDPLRSPRPHNFGLLTLQALNGVNAAPFYFVIRLRRIAGRVIGLSYSTSRTRHLVFDKYS